MAERFTIIRNGRLVDVRRGEAAPADILIEGDRILSIGATGMDAPADARIVDASDRAMMPGWSTVTCADTEPWPRVWSATAGHSNCFSTRYRE
jgi:N-acyl-D-aspartate/D-glutamate deacylase